MNAKLALAGVAFLTSGGVFSEDQKLSYPPLEAPLYLECKMKGANEAIPVKEWPGVALYFPKGIISGFPEPQIVDKHGQLEGGSYRFSIRSEKHWSLIDSDGVPNASELAGIPQIMFLPPSGNGENFKIVFLKKANIFRTGFCFGLVGPNAKFSYEASVADPSRID